MSIVWYIFKTHARDFERYLKFLVNLENKIFTIVETRYIIFQIISRMVKNVENRGQAFFYQALFIYKKWDTFDDFSLT